MAKNNRRVVLSARALGIVVVLLGVFFVPGIAVAQATFGGGTEINDLPIDGGVSLLVAAGVGYGVKKLYNRKK
jgi:hypothetical protein